MVDLVKIGRRRFALAVIVAACLTAGANADGPRTYRAVQIGNEQFGAVAVALNDAAEVVGLGTYGLTVPGALMSPHECPFYYRNGSLINLESKLGTFAQLHAINNSGSAVGRGGNAGGSIRSFLFADNQMVDVGSLGGTSTEALGMNNKNDVVGLSYVDTTYWHAFLYQKGAMKDLGTLGGRRSQACAINDAGEIVGWSDLANRETHGFLYSKGKMTDIGSIGGHWSDARAINGKGEVVGETTTKDGGIHHAFLYSNGQMTDLGPAEALSSKANGINDAGQVVGQILLPDGKDRLQAALFENGKAYNLNKLVSNFGATDLKQFPMIEAMAINAKGQIIANDLRGRGYLLTPNRK